MLQTNSLKSDTITFKFTKKYTKQKLILNLPPHTVFNFVHQTGTCSSVRMPLKTLWDLEAWRKMDSGIRYMDLILFWSDKRNELKELLKRIFHPKKYNLLNIYSSSGHSRCRWVCFFIRTGLEKFSEWVPSERESKQHNTTPLQSIN